MSVRISRLQFEHHRANALGIGEVRPRISWRFAGSANAWVQSAYELEITRLRPSLPSAPATAQPQLQTYSVESSESRLVPWEGEDLTSGETASVRVRAFSLQTPNETDWSEAVLVEPGLLSREVWEPCSLITAPSTAKSIPEGENTLSQPKQPLLLRRSFTLPNHRISRARVYITAQGIYEAHLNGQRIGDHVLAPGWTSYAHHLAHQTFDVTDLLIAGGENVLSAQVAEGWFAGRLGFLGGNRDIWGGTLGLVAKVAVEYEDSSSEQGGIPRTVICTDAKWKVSTASLVTSEIYDGEVCDLNREPKGWQQRGFDDSAWEAVRVLPLPSSTKLVSPTGPPVRKIEELPAKEIITSPSGRTIVDFGQNLVGWVRVRLSGPRGIVVTLQHGEVLENGEVAVRPLRECKARDQIVLSGEDQEWEPKFTFHGFRYVDISGLSGVTLGTATAVVVHTDMEQTGWFECSNPLLNQLHNNIRWGMRGNFVSTPTDCPQRDERLGWTGDIHIFAPTANYLYDTCGMLKSWVTDLAAEQLSDGSGVPPHFCPNVFPQDPKAPAAIWGDVVIGLPWALYLAYGDPRILSDQLDSMQGWLDEGIPRDEDTGLWRDDSYRWQYGDWLDPKAPPSEPADSMTDSLLVANAYLVHMTSLMHEIGLALHRNDIAEKYSRQAASLKTAFQRRYITPEGRVVSDTQTGLALAIIFNLFSNPQQESTAGARLKLLVQRNSRFKIATGFAGTPIIGHALSKIGETQLFYRMLYHRKVPSWLYQVTMGATTPWERWDSMLPDGSVNPGEMTSFNHYALGSVADWMHSTIVGLRALTPGWKRFRVQPRPGGDLRDARGRFISSYGEIIVSWSINDGHVDGNGEGDGDSTFNLKVQVPPNTSAEIILPTSGRSIDVLSGVHELNLDRLKS
ncbi:bacterial alpha-L-rhamnosidase-domain-containing protein [Aspergillus germanicus]